MELVIASLILAIVVQILFFIPAYIFQTDKVTDLSYSLTFLILALFGLFTTEFSSFKVLVTILIVAWTFRLASYLFIRIIHMKTDKRFDGIRESITKFGTFWLFQGILVWIIMLPSLFFYSQNQPAITAITFLGFGIWGIGFSIEAIADYQKYVFKRRPQNKLRWIETGLWKYSRHPNYFGEILCWVGIYILVLPALPLNHALLALLSPLAIYITLRHMSGIPLLEKGADSKWGRNPKYLDYKKRTSLLMLLPPRAK
jgi:steroid 5-alpha reductase family enzyme